MTKLVSNITASSSPPYKDIFGTADQQTREWTDAAARGETAWVCSDCGTTFLDGVPDECAYRHARCEEILKRDKEEARYES